MGKLTFSTYQQRHYEMEPQTNETHVEEEYIDSSDHMEDYDSEEDYIGLEDELNDFDGWDNAGGGEFSHNRPEVTDHAQ